jgi:hypothetical protein
VAQNVSGSRQVNEGQRVGSVLKGWLLQNPHLGNAENKADGPSATEIGNLDNLIKHFELYNV